MSMVRWMLFVALFLFACLVLRARLAGGATNRHHRRMRHQADNALGRMRREMAKEPARIFGYLRALHPHAVEELVLSAAEAAGHRVKRNSVYTGDGGIDGMIEVGGLWHLVQTKRYRSAIRPEHVREFAVLCRARRMPGLFIHTGRTGETSVAHAAEAGGVRFVSGTTLVRLIIGDAIA